MTNSTKLLRYWSSGRNSTDSYFFCLPKDINDLVEKYIVDDLLFVQVNSGLFKVYSYINGTPYYPLPNAHACYTAYGNTIVIQSRPGKLAEINLLSGKEKGFPQIDLDKGVLGATNVIQVTPAHKGWLVYHDSVAGGGFYYFQDSDYQNGDIQKSPSKLNRCSYNQLSLDRSNDGNRHQVSFFKTTSNSVILNIYDLNEDHISYALQMGSNSYTSLVMYGNSIYYHRNGIIECLDPRSNILRQLGTASSIIPYKDSIMLLSCSGPIDESINYILSYLPVGASESSIYRRMKISPNIRFIHSLSSI